jgi:nucleoid-associated protein YgaU
VLNLINQLGVRLQNVHIENNKLLIRGEAPSEDVKNRVWDQIKLVDPSYTDLTADITVSPQAAAQERAQAAGAQGSDAHRTYQVRPGDTLSKIAKQYYGNPSEYMRIFEANRDKLKDPDKIQPGQELVIP